MRWQTNYFDKKLYANLIVNCYQVCDGDGVHGYDCGHDRGCDYGGRDHDGHGHDCDARAVRGCGCRLREREVVQ